MQKTVRLEYQISAHLNRNLPGYRSYRMRVPQQESALHPTPDYPGNDQSANGIVSGLIGAAI
jgi:hypothetical protein